MTRLAGKKIAILLAEGVEGTWVDEASFRECNQVWGRVVADIPAFCRELVAALVDSRK